MRNSKYDQKIGRRKKTLRSPLNLDEEVLVLAERLKKKDAPGNLYKASTNNMDNLKFRIFSIYKRARLNNGTYLYIGQKKTVKEINGRFLRQELFAINKQFEK